MNTPLSVNSPDIRPVYFHNIQSSDWEITPGDEPRLKINGTDDAIEFQSAPIFRFEQITKNRKMVGVWAIDGNCFFLTNPGMNTDSPTSFFKEELAQPFLKRRPAPRKVPPVDLGGKRNYVKIAHLRVKNEIGFLPTGGLTLAYTMQDISVEGETPENLAKVKIHLGVALCKNSDLYHRRLGARIALKRLDESLETGGDSKTLGVRNVVFTMKKTHLRTVLGFQAEKYLEFSQASHLPDSTPEEQTKSFTALGSTYISNLCLHTELIETLRVTLENRGEDYPLMSAAADVIYDVVDQVYDDLYQEYKVRDGSHFENFVALHSPIFTP